MKQKVNIEKMVSVFSDIVKTRGRKYLPITSEEVRQIIFLADKRNYSASRISKILGRSLGVVLRVLRRNGCQVRLPCGSRRLSEYSKALIKSLTLKGYSQSEIAYYLKLGQSTIRRWQEKLNIERQRAPGDPRISKRDRARIKCLYDSGQYTKKELGVMFGVCGWTISRHCKSEHDHNMFLYKDRVSKRRKRTERRKAEMEAVRQLL